MDFKKIGIYITTIMIALWFISQVLYPASRTLTHGFGAYYSAARLLRLGQFSERVYDPAYFRPIVRADSHQQADDIYNANPPTTSLMLWPLSFLAIEQARFIWTLAQAVLLFSGLALLLLTFAPQPTLPTFALLASLGMLFQPVLENIRLGQAYLLIFFLCATAVTVWSKDSVNEPTRRGSLALALLLILKTAGWPLLPILIWQRRWRSLAWAIGFVVLFLVFTLPLFPLSLWQRYGQLLGDSGNAGAVCATAYQTTRSLLCQRFVFDPVWSPSPLINLPWLATLFFMSLALITLAINFKLSHHHQALVASVVWGVIFAPLGEQYHHTVMLIPLSWLIINWPLLNRFSQISFVVGTALYLVPLHLSDWFGLIYLQVYGAWFILFALYSLTKLPTPAPAPRIF